MTNGSQRGATAPWSVTLLTVKEIPIRVHLSFFLLLAYIVFFDGENGSGAISRVLFVLAIFSCVVLHELGHALTAKLFKIRTRDIVLYPFGGIASLMSEGKPKEEFFIAIAGPMVNLLIAVICAPFMDFNFLTASISNAPGFLTRFFLANVLLAFFNLIPALPMDGGRILRSALALLGVRNATGIATRISQGICILMGVFAYMTGNVLLVVISVLVFSNAVQEHLREKTRFAAVGILAREVMTEAPFLQTFTHGVTVSQALKAALKSFQIIFPVVHSGDVIGIISRDALIETGALDADDSYISGHMDRDFSTIAPDVELSQVLEKMQTDHCESLIVLENGSLVGVIFKEKVLEYLLVTEFKRKAIQHQSSDREEF